MISIPNPCNEDFDKMTPTERGAFCEVCSTDTFDFRNLSNNEIYQIIDENKGQHLCGRFTKAQLESLSTPGYFAWKNQTKRTFQSKFLLACLLVFGLSLFSCEDEEDAGALKEIKIEQVFGDIDPEIRYINETEQLEIISSDLLDYIEPEIEECEIEFAGEMAVEYEQPIDVYKERTDYVTGGVIAMDPTILGGLKVDIEVDSTEENTLANPIETDPVFFQAKAYPNPTQGLTTLALDIEKEGQFEIMLYNMNGQLVTSVHSGHLYTGRQTFEIDLQEQNSGIYIIKVISKGQDETLKVQKLN